MEEIWDLIIQIKGIEVSERNPELIINSLIRAIQNITDKMSWQNINLKLLNYK